VAAAVCQPAGQAHPLWGWRILFTDSEDFPNNETRFRGHRPPEVRAQKTGPHDKTCGQCSASRTQPGSLVEALDIFKQGKINLTWN